MTDDRMGTPSNTERYYLNGESLPTIPVPHDCVIKSIRIEDKCIVFIFEDDISYHDSIKHYKQDARSLIVRYHLAYDRDDFQIYEWVYPKKPFRKNGCFKQLANSRLPELVSRKFKLEYLYHNVGYCSIITKLFAGVYIILDAEVDYVELEWIC